MARRVKFQDSDQSSIQSKQHNVQLYARTRMSKNIDQQAGRKAATFQIKNSSAGPSLRRSRALITTKQCYSTHISMFMDFAARSIASRILAIWSTSSKQNKSSGRVHASRIKIARTIWKNISTTRPSCSDNLGKILRLLRLQYRRLHQLSGQLEEKYFDYFFFNIIDYDVNCGLIRSGARRRALVQTIGNAWGLDINSSRSAENQPQDL
jgi:hypothetical protein